MSRRVWLSLLLAVVVAVGGGAAAWAVSAPAGAVGHDVSYPQCGTALPTTGRFGVVGVNGGKVSTANPCLATQYAWAAGTANGADLYVNTGNPGAISTFYWSQSGTRDPVLCTDRNSSSDPGCAYNYGWHGGQDSLRIARNALGSGVTARTWWLDVELANSWNGTPAANAASLQGALDALANGGIGTVGIYSTGYQWGQITGGFTASTAATYRSGWAKAFTPKRALESAPLWIAGLSTLDAASKNCATSFTGARAVLAQYSDGNLDGDLVCGAPPTTTPAPTTTTAAPTTTTTTAPTTTAAPSTTAPTTTTTTTVPTTTTKPTTAAPTTTTTTTRPTTSAPAPTAPGAPTGVTATTDPTRGIVLRWTAPTQTGGSPVNRYVILRGNAPGRETVLGVLTCRTAQCAWRDTSVAAGATAYYQVAAANDANQVGPRSPEVSARAR
ncbi:hypothetical protein [Actinomycetospora sp. NBRC 106378]|uniref:hypothetical protein n=1 Tax=Actinomycetospora sp. NBRC 106378 TaxID=3032208 RepID=UPI0024A5FF68|nr:hypothetical protein [Actinomycetospora sp. NBRC 106378]GLZ51022.1 hypothetical protein Acsp07_06390 [Actinomycetospora sp. NBRC 106378]